ncbi:hypothetical protein NBRC116594_25660 [Shimia sp. NS0008-38b]|uniref:acyloxyacyl hydrolase n=1 Tax=Shimia sp. NS0008-38b TaxID=3127653 RepID=UPI0031032B26
MKFLATLISLTLFCTPISAQQLIFGIGYSDFSEGSALDAQSFSIEYVGKPFREVGRLSVSLSAIASFDDEDNTFVGVGITNLYDFTDRWFAELSFMPGVYLEGNPLNDLGNTLEFRSLLGLGFRVTETSAISLAFDHKSNAGISTRNPGVNTLALRYHYNF